MLASLEPRAADAGLTPALNKSFPGFAFTVATIGDPYWRAPHAVVAADGTRRGDHRAWVERELAELGGDLAAFRIRHRQDGEKFAEWRGTSAFAFTPTGPGVADFIQLSLGREIEVLAGPVVDPDYRPTTPTISSSRPGFLAIPLPRRSRSPDLSTGCVAAPAAASFT